MSRFHINKHGVPAPCKAKQGNCPFGGDDQHFLSQEAAQAHADQINAQEFGVLPDVNDPFSKDNIRKQFPEASEKQIAQIKDYCLQEESIRDIVENLKNNNNKGEDEYFNQVQEVRKLALTKYESYNNIKQFTDDGKLTELLSEKIPEPEPWKRGPNYNFHPEIEDKNFHYGIGPVISAYTGKPKNQIRQEIQEIMNDKNISLHEATKEYWRTTEQRTDKPIISLDLETANPRDKSLTYDNGQLTYIIELGAIKTYPDGTTETLDIQYGIPEAFEKRHGTGFQETHNISPDDIRGLEEFTDNQENQKKILNFLDNSVIIAHNAYFENKQLTNSLKGFRKKVDEGNIEMLDTMNFCKFLVPEAERNTNEAFVKAADMKYEGAHRAFQDATMTLNAFNKLKNNR